MRIEDIEITCSVSGLAIAVVVGRACVPPPVDAALALAVAHAKAEPTPEPVRKAVRDMLRFGKYKPTGRGKPASEYLLQAATEGEFPRVSPLVDWCNVASLQTGVPISLIDLSRAATTHFQVRRGRPDESYVFNASGQSIALEDLLLVARGPGDEACANAVKDSMATKLTPEAGDVLAVIYAPTSLAEQARAAMTTLMTAYGPRCAANLLHE